jgi:hypothetical protein
MPRREPRAVVGLLVGALALIAASGYLAAELRLAYQPADLAYSDGPRSFQAWLSRTWRGAPDGDEAASAIAARLLAMPIAARRATVASMADEAFWTGAVADEAGRRALQAHTRAAVLAALRQAPAAGELWLAAAVLQTRLDGFDERASSYLAASYRFAPREGQVAYGRAGLIAHILPVLDGPLAEAAANDLGLIAAAYPRLDRRLAPVIARMERRR